jgi:hypothetical protein
MMHACQELMAQRLRGGASQECNEVTANTNDNVPCLRHEFPWLLDVTQRLNANVAQLHRAICLFMGQARPRRCSGIDGDMRDALEHLTSRAVLGWSLFSATPLPGGVQQ